MKWWVVFLSSVLLVFPFTTVMSQKRKPAPKANYNTVPFDETVNQVIPDEPGHDPDEVYNSIIRIRAATKLKDEFETTKQYDARFRAAFEKPIYGLLTVDDLFAFRINTAWFRYNADEGILHGYIFYRTVYPMRPNALCIKLAGLPKNPNKLVFLDIENPEKLNIVYEPDAASRMIHLMMRCDAEVAKKLKPHLVVLAVIKLSQPYAFRDLKGDLELRYLNGSVVSFWVFDKRSGQVVSKGF